jgi:hypothetical protein
MAARERRRRSRRNRHLALTHGLTAKRSELLDFARWRAAEIKVPRPRATHKHLLSPPAALSFHL